jgi:hypothetical protein
LVDFIPLKNLTPKLKTLGESAVADSTHQYIIPKKKTPEKSSKILPSCPEIPPQTGFPGQYAVVVLGLVVVSLLMDTEGWPISMTVTETEAPVDAMASSIFWLSDADVSF